MNNGIYPCVLNQKSLIFSRKKYKLKKPYKIILSKEIDFMGNLRRRKCSL